MKDFEFTKFFSPRVTAREARLDLTEDLSRIIRENQADGITKLRLSVVNINTSTVTFVEIERWFGAPILVLWLADAAVGPYTQDHEQVSLSFAAVGALMFGGSFLHESLGTVNYWIDVSGTAVRFKAPVAAAP